MPVTARPATAGDVPAIARVHVASWRSTYRGLVPDAHLDALVPDAREPLWREVVPRGGVHVADDAQEGLVGFVSVDASREPLPGFTGELYALYLLAHRQRGGLGRRLVAAGARHLLAQGHRGMLLWVIAANPAVRFYERLGGMRVGARVDEVGGARLDEVAFGRDEAGLRTLAAMRRTRPHAGRDPARRSPHQA